MLALLLQAAASCFLMGLIWIVQVVHYPLMSRVGADRFAEYERLHAAWITPVVGPAMLLEAALAAWLLMQPPAGIPGWSTKVGLALVVLIWGVTFFVSVPCHAQLAAGFDAAAHDRLVSTNWIRTIACTARAALSLWMLWQALELKKA
jgi:hypothetical protein